MNKSASKLTDHALFDFFNEIINNIRDKTGHDIIIHYNNLELLPDNKIRKIFNNLRDFFQIEGIHFIFIGNFTTNSIVNSLPRVSNAKVLRIQLRI